MRVALVSREVYPLTGGGIGAFVSAAARLLSESAEVTVLTSSAHAPAYRRLLDARDPGLPPDRVRLEFVSEPTAEEAGGWYDVVQCYGARVLERLRELYPDGGPDVLEFADYLGEGFVTLQAAQARDPFLDGTCVCVRLHTTRELCVVLNAHYPQARSERVQFDLERYSLAHADRLIWEGGDILDTYRRFYGAHALAGAVRIRYPYDGPMVEAELDREFVPGAPLRLLYAGRLERRKGVLDLVSAAAGTARDDFQLTLLGADTPTGPLGTSVRELLELAAADDPRIEIRGAVSRSAVAQAIRGHDVIVVPSRWECWPYAVLEALHLNRPVLATPRGGLAELVKPGASGWLAPSSGRDALGAAIEALLDERAQLAALVREGRPQAHAQMLSAEAAIIEGYRALARVKPRRRRLGPAMRRESPLVSAVVPYYRSARYVTATIESLLAQTYSRLEIVLVNDGSLAPDDQIVAEIAARVPVMVVTQMNQGLGAARNLGIALSRGRYIFPLDSDNVAEPDFVARCVEVLEHAPQLAYVTAWSRYIDPEGRPLAGPTLGYQPLGNQGALVAEDNVAGDAAAILPRRIFDAGFRYSSELTSFEDWALYRELARAGRWGAVIPERLLRYRVRPDSMQAQIAAPKRARLHGEIEALMRENAVLWTSSSA
jgi:glycogen(starch) synthase